MLEENQNRLSKKIGAYLLCSEGAIQNALKKQNLELENDTQHKLMGELLIESGNIDQEQLHNALIKQRIDRLTKCPVFSTLNKTELAALSKHFYEVSVPPYREFIIEGDDDPTMYVLASGKVEVYRMDLDANKTVFAELGPGEPIGEMAYFSGGLRTATVRTLEMAELLRANYSELTFYFEHAPQVAHAFMQLVNNRRLELEQNKK